MGFLFLQYNPDIFSDTSYTLSSITSLTSIVWMRQLGTHQGHRAAPCAVTPELFRTVMIAAIFTTLAIFVSLKNIHTRQWWHTALDLYWFNCVEHDVILGNCGLRKRAIERGNKRFWLAAESYWSVDSFPFLGWRNFYLSEVMPWELCTLLKTKGYEYDYKYTSIFS